MGDTYNKYKVVREYRNDYSIDEVLKRIIRMHIGTICPDMKKIKECSDRGVHEIEK